jgi:hypothetical protein
MSGIKNHGDPMIPSKYLVELEGTRWAGRYAYLGVPFNDTWKERKRNCECYTLASDSGVTRPVLETLTEEIQDQGQKHYVFHLAHRAGGVVGLQVVISVAVNDLAFDRELLLSRSTSAVRDCYCRVFIHPMVDAVRTWRYHTAIVAQPMALLFVS